MGVSARFRWSHPIQGRITPVFTSRIYIYNIYYCQGEGLMSPQTETKAFVGFKAGVKEYKLTYYTPQYEVKDTDILAAF
ncbi:hypothetical protein J1N35_007639 [Gossypium stocksii]|uniref:Ribulose bisphosphate carboxylase large chain n=1 Tax=Gossypium stocksii TaxID=47602 RepID=A0A9D3W6Y3_9ROSI|nr:hypothetical protein J1N35_007639 [Gossypium stocksii]